MYFLQERMLEVDARRDAASLYDTCLVTTAGSFLPVGKNYVTDARPEQTLDMQVSSITNVS